MVVAEWMRLIRAYAGREVTPGLVEACMTWSDTERDTTLARLTATRVTAAGRPLVCVWSGTGVDLRAMDIDHALPWSVWPCGDLRNLLPVSRRVNQYEKRDQLPNALTLAQAREPIIGWWHDAWFADPALAERFRSEARAPLPIKGDVTPESAFAGMEWRLRVRQDQGAPEWADPSPRPRPTTGQ